MSIQKHLALFDQQVKTKHRSSQISSPRNKPGHLRTHPKNFESTNGLDFYELLRIDQECQKVLLNLIRFILMRKVRKHCAHKNYGPDEFLNQNGPSPVYPNP